MQKASAAHILAAAGLLLCMLACPVARADGAPPRLAELEGMLSAYEGVPSYEDFLSSVGDRGLPGATLTLNAAAYAGAEGMRPRICGDYAGMAGDALWTDEAGMVWWRFDVAESGLYGMEMLYYPVEGNSSDIQRAVFIDGRLPFQEAAVIDLERVWKRRDDEFRLDNRGNQLRGVQAEAPEWIARPVTDSQGYYTQPLLFYLEAGPHTLALVSRREPLVLRSITLRNQAPAPSYREVLAGYRARGLTEAPGGLLRVPAETPHRVSSPTLNTESDKGGPAVTPCSPRYILQNTVGGQNWKLPGQWIEWEIEAPAAGLYRLGVNAKQTWVRSGYVARRLTIDGALPFREAGQLEFYFADGWRQTVFGGEEPYLFYLSEGRHTVRLEAVLGDFAEVVREAERCVAGLNTAYRRIVMLTGHDIDRWRDYQIERNLPGLRDSLEAERLRLQGIIQKVRAVSDRMGDRDAILTVLSDQIALFLDDMEKIPLRKDAFKTNIGALGNWLMYRKEVPLALDEIYLLPADAAPPALNDSFFANLGHEMRRLYYSFVIDYNSIGDVTDDGSRSVTVWVVTGRDQANTMKALIDESFTPETGIGVNLMLMGADTLLPATLAGQGPDVAMMVANDLPMNYALRGAVADLTQFDDFDRVAARFRPSALVPFTHRGSCYALPETQTFNMMFYRKDIMRELGFGLPETWDDVRALMSLLSRNNMEFGMVPIPAQQMQGSANFGAANTAPSQTDLMFGMFLFQHGGAFYTPDGRRSALGSDIAVNAFKEWTQFYTDYTLTREFDFQSRFRIGEVPIGIADYSLYNLLQVAAPEIKGLWGFAQVPGTRRDDGTIDHSVPSSGTATVIMNTTDDRESCWEFLKWWTDAPMQTAYGRAIEALQGPAARYPTANIRALPMLSWPVQDLRNLQDQYENVRGIPQVPGGYYTARNVTNAFATVVIDKKIGPREALMDNVKMIDNEIRSKRAEFHLD